MISVIAERGRNIAAEVPSRTPASTNNPDKPGSDGLKGVNLSRTSDALRCGLLHRTDQLLDHLADQPGVVAFGHDADQGFGA